MSIQQHPRHYVQALLWGLLWLLLPLVLSNNWAEYDSSLRRSLPMSTGVALLVWANLAILLPNLYFGKKRRLYAWAGLLLLIGLLLLVYWEQAPWYDWAEMGRWGRPRPGKPPREPRPGAEAFKWLGRSLPFITAYIGSSLVAVANYASQKEKEAIQLQKEKLEAELKFLKSQINPHFLFNALNNIYTLVLLKAEQAPDNLMRLSEMLRYMLYDCDADRVPLQKELDYLNNYIHLQQLKDSAGFNVHSDWSGARPDVRIAPMLFIPFVENAFKHSHIENQDKGWIDIQLRTEGQSLFFTVRNSLPQQALHKDRVGGIGLDNIRRQLELLYPGRYQLDIRQEAASFSVALVLDLG